MENVKIADADRTDKPEQKKDITSSGNNRKLQPIFHQSEHAKIISTV